MSYMPKPLTVILLAVFTLGLGGCCAYEPSAKQGKCASDRTWVAPAQDADGEWKDGYCAWEEGKAP